MPKRITLVLPYYNEEHYILPTLRAIAAQDTRDFRLIIVNNRSSDGSPALVEAFLAASNIDYAHVEEDTPGVVPRADARVSRRRRANSSGSSMPIQSIRRTMCRTRWHCSTPTRRPAA